MVGVALLDDIETKVAFVTIDLIFAYAPLRHGIRTTVEKQTDRPTLNLK